MRENKFRGKRVDNGELVYGWYYQLRRSENEVVHYIVENPLPLLNGVKEYIVIPETIGQFTGLLDKNGKEIYEGDEVHCWGGEYYQGYWEFNDVVVVKDIRDLGIVGMTEYCEVIGNIHEVQYEHPCD